MGIEDGTTAFPTSLLGETSLIEDRTATHEILENITCNDDEGAATELLCLPVMDPNKKKTIRVFEIQGLQLSEGKRVGESNLFHGFIKSDRDIPVAYHCHTKGDEDLQKWHDMGLELCSPYVLRVHGRAKCSEVDKEVLVTETVEGSLKCWVTGNPLLDETSPHITLHPLFRNYLRDILKGMHFLRFDIKQPHGEIREHNIFISRGIAKLANVLHPDRYPLMSFGDDINKFCGMIRRLFNQKGIEIPLELDKFCRSLQRYGHSDSYFRNAVNHPALLGPMDRCHYRHIAYSRVWDSYLQNQVERRLVGELKNAQMFCQWRENIQVQEYRDALYYSAQPQIRPKLRRRLLTITSIHFIPDSWLSCMMFLQRRTFIFLCIEDGAEGQD